MDLGAARDDAQRESTYRFLNDELAEQDKVLLDEARGLETKATLVAGFAVTAVSFLLANRRGLLWWLALGAHLAALLVALAVLWSGRNSRPGNLISLLEDAAPVVAVGFVLQYKAEAYRRNLRSVRKNAVLWRLGAVFIVVATGLSVWSSIVEGLR
jgi:hypothetical protein